MTDREHLLPDSLALYVTGALDGVGRGRVERHVLACADCAAGLTREAALEMALYEVGASAVSSDCFARSDSSTSSARSPLSLAARRRRRWLAPVVSACAAAAAILLVSAWSWRAPSVVPAGGQLSGQSSNQASSVIEQDGGWRG